MNQTFHARAWWEDTKMPKKRKTLRQEMMHALLSHGEAHDVAVRWFEKQDRLKRAKRKGHNDRTERPERENL